MFCLSAIVTLATISSIRSHHQSNHVVFHVRSNHHPSTGRILAEEHGLDYVSPVFPGSNYHHAVMRTDLEPSQRSSERLMSMLADPRIVWVKRQTYQPRQLRFIVDPDEGVRPFNQQRDIRSIGSDTHSGSRLDFNDPLYPLQWYLHGGNGQSRHHLNVTSAWRDGLTGRGVAVAVLDDEINGLNPEIRRNYDPNISGDLGARSGPGLKKNPMHGTYCAAVIAAEANNSFCGVGVAFHARVGGVRLLAKKRVLDVQEARALNYKLPDIDIYSASWGPPDDGQHIGGPGMLARHALERGIEEGRGGLGSIYIWASGNGGLKGDNCAYDSYASSIYTITVSALTPNGRSPFYAEPCPATLTSLYVGGQHRRPLSFLDVHSTSNVVVSFGDAGCQNQFQGTSAAAPLAAGIVALLLEANPRLRWRDVQHLVVLNSSPSNEDNSTSWSTNGAGLRSNVLLGFGALDAGRLVQMGRRWENVPPQIQNTIPCPSGRISLSVNQPVRVDIHVDSNIGHLEYVALTVDVEVKPIGTLSISLQSPSGMISPLLVPRPNDKINTQLRNWNLTSSQFWGEYPVGLWRVFLTNTAISDAPATMHSCSLTLFGF